MSFTRGTLIYVFVFTNYLVITNWVVIWDVICNKFRYFTVKYFTASCLNAEVDSHSSTLTYACHVNIYFTFNFKGNSSHNFPNTTFIRLWFWFPCSNPNIRNISISPMWNVWRNTNIIQSYCASFHLRVKPIFKSCKLKRQRQQSHI